MKQLTKNIYFETKWSGANVGCIVTGEGLIMIDTPHCPSDAVVWKKEVESKGTVKYLINTESHDDHFLSDFFFKVPVIAQEKTREAIAAADIERMRDPIAFKDPAGLALIKDYKKNMPAITFSERLTLYFDKLSLHLSHLPGHCAGQTAVLIPEERVVFTGDNVCYKIQGFMHTADPYAWLESLERIAEMDVDYIVPGHGEVCDKSYIPDQVDFVQDCIDKIKKAIKQGWTKEETLARVSFSRYPLDLGLEKHGKIMLDLSVANTYDIVSKKK